MVIHEIDGMCLTMKNLTGLYCPMMCLFNYVCMQLLFYFICRSPPGTMVFLSVMKHSLSELIVYQIKFSIDYFNHCIMALLCRL